MQLLNINRNLAGKIETHVEESFHDGIYQNMSFQNISGGIFCVRMFCSLLLHYLHVKVGVLLRYFSRSRMSLIDVYKFKCKVETQPKMTEHAFKISPRFTAPRQSFAVEFVAIKQLAYESLHVEPSRCLDVVVYMFNCVFW